MRVLELALVSSLATAVAIVSVGSVRADDASTIAVDDQLQQLITQICRQAIPRNYENHKKWGRQEEVTRGLYVGRDGWHIKTHRTKKFVNQGTWTRYEIELLDPGRRLVVRLDNVHRLPNQRLAFDIICAARLRVLGQLANWQQGVQLVSMRAVAEADVRLTICCDVMAKLDFSEMPPGLVLDPAVRSANLLIQRFRLDRISRVGGALARSLSASVREVLERELQRRNEKLLTQINRQLEKNHDKFHVSLRDTLRVKL